jgi:hypothetical protein
MSADLKSFDEMSMCSNTLPWGESLHDVETIPFGRQLDVSNVAH